MIASAIAMYLFTKKWPKSEQDWLQPQIGGVDERGKPRRMAWPNYLSRDVYSATRRPFNLEDNSLLKYATGGMADWWQAVHEAWVNRKFDGSFVVNPREGNEFHRFVERLAHAAWPFDTSEGMPTFMTQNARQLEAEGISRGKRWGIIAMGGGPAARSGDLTPAEYEFQRLNSLNFSNAGESDAIQQRLTLMRQITAAARNQEDPTEYIQFGIQNGLLNRNDIKRAMTKADFDYLPEQIANSRLGLEDVLSIYKKASPEQQRDIEPEVAKKLQTIKSERNPQEKIRLLSLYDQIVNHHAY
jgi:hypothetical protein